MSCKGMPVVVVVDIHCGCMGSEVDGSGLGSVGQDLNQGYVLSRGKLIMELWRGGGNSGWVSSLHLVPDPLVVPNECE